MVWMGRCINMIIKYKLKNENDLLSVNSDEMTLIEKAAFMNKVFNFDYIVVDESGNMSDEIRLLILKGKF